MANFVPFSSASNRAWRTLYRMRGREGASHHRTTGLTGAEGAGGTCRGAGGRRQGQGGPRDRPLRAVRLACGDLAGGPPPTGTHSGPAHQSNPRDGWRSGGQAARRPESRRGNKHNEAARPHRGPGGSRFRPLGDSQRFQRIWVPSEPRRWQASTTRAAMPASADLPHVRGSYCFFTPTSPSILRTPS